MALHGSKNKRDEREVVASGGKFYFASMLFFFLHVVTSLLVSLFGVSKCSAQEVASQAIKNPTLSEVVASKQDLWGELARRQVDGPSYEFFDPLLPPPRYVHADFRFYPLVLSGPRQSTKARLISNGSGVNLRGGSRSWKEIGTPIAFRVGPDEFRFGGLTDRVSHPKPLEGWLPIYEITYRHPYPVESEGLVPIDQRPTKRPAEVYRLEAFATTDPSLEKNAVVLVRFSLAAGTRGIVTVQFDPASDRPPVDRELRNDQGEAVAIFDSHWTYERRGMHAKLGPGQAVTLAIATTPLPANSFSMKPGSYDEHRDQTIAAWRSIVDQAMQVQVGESRINDAWKNLIVQNWMLLQQDRMFYSADNQYEQLYVAEGGDAVRAMADWGYEDLGKQVLLPIVDHSRKGLENHQAGLKLHDMAHLYWSSRDPTWLRSQRSRWERELSRLMSPRSENDFLLPKERYCGDVSTQVHSLSVEAKGWRALHDWVPILDELNETTWKAKVDDYERKLRPKLLSAVMRSVRRESDPPFIPLALLDREEPHSPITATRIGSYWNLLSNFVIGSRLFDTGSPEEEWLPRYIENHGGLCMGMTRSGGLEHGFWTGSERTNPLYGTRYVLDTLRRDEPDRALTSFYGMLAHGFTRETLVAGEACTLNPVDEHGRFFYCPPNSAGNAHFLTLLRNLLVQDWDIDGDGKPETLRLLYGTSRRWLRDGQSIRIQKGPTSFGPVSLQVDSDLSHGKVTAVVDLPERNQPQEIRMRIRLPEGWQIAQVLLGTKSLPIAKDQSFSLTDEKGRLHLELKVLPTAN